MRIQLNSPNRNESMPGRADHGVNAATKIALYTFNEMSRSQRMRSALPPGNCDLPAWFSRTKREIFAAAGMVRGGSHLWNH